MSDSTGTPASEQDEIAAQNLAVADAIRDYCKYPHSQQFAVMVDGPWGSGKTYLIKALLDDLVQTNDNGAVKPLYISLYGISSAAEIDERIYQQLHPVLSHRYTRIAGIVFKGLLKTAIKIDLDQDHKTLTVNPQMPDLKLSDVLNGAPGRVFIFDDFERAVMCPLDVLGYINQLVEHDTCKVVILANEAEVAGAKDGDAKHRSPYQLRKEKTVGRTLRVKANGYAAYDSLVDGLENESAKAFLKRESASVLKIFLASELENIRLLRHFLWDFERFWPALTPAQQAHEQGMREILCLLYAITVEIRSGRRSADGPFSFGIVQQMRMDSGKADEGTKSAADMRERYPTVNFGSGLLSDDTIRQIVLYSAIKRDDIQRQLTGHPYFLEPEEQPTWRTLWHAADLDEAGRKEALKWFGKDLDQRTFQTPDEIMHVVGLSLWLAKIGEPGWDQAAVEVRLRKYIDDVCSHADWATAAAGVSDTTVLSGGALGLGFYVSESAEFKALTSYLVKATEKARTARYPAIAADLKAQMSSDSEGFLRDVCVTVGGSARYARLAILSLIPAREFADAFMALPYTDQNKVAMALSIRYENASIYTELASEIQWLVDVYNELTTAVERLPPMPRYYANNLIKQYIPKCLPPPTAPGP